MRKSRGRSSRKLRELKKIRSGVAGLDAITGGRLPKGRPTLVSGSAGSGKTLLAMQFLVHGAVSENEPGVFVTFEESAEDLINNVASLGFDLAKLQADRAVVLEHIAVAPSEYHEAGDFDLSGLF